MWDYGGLRRFPKLYFRGFGSFQTVYFYGGHCFFRTFQVEVRNKTGRAIAWLRVIPLSSVIVIWNSKDFVWPIVSPPSLSRHARRIRCQGNGQLWGNSMRERWERGPWIPKPVYCRPKLLFKYLIPYKVTCQSPTDHEIRDTNLAIALGFLYIRPEGPGVLLKIACERSHIHIHFLPLLVHALVFSSLAGTICFIAWSFSTVI